MKPNSMFWVELIDDTRKRRSLVLKFVLPVILVIPFTIDQISTSIRYAGLPLIVLFLGVLGSSVGLSGMRERGLLERLSTLPVKRTRLVRDYIAANVAMDALQMIVPASILGLSFGIDAGAATLLALALVLCIVFSNSLGVLIAVAAGGSGEVHLYSAMCVLGVAGLSGIFFQGGAMMSSISDALPFGLLKGSFGEMAAGADGLRILAPGIVTVLMAWGSVLSAGRLFSNKG